MEGRNVTCNISGGNVAFPNFGDQKIIGNPVGFQENHYHGGKGASASEGKLIRVLIS